MRRNFLISFLLLIALFSCKNPKQAKETPIYFDLVEQSMDESGSVKALDKDGNEVELKVLSEEELQLMHTEFNEKYPNMI